MLDLAQVTAETFDPLVGQTFEVIFTDGRLPLTLDSVSRFGGQSPARTPFSLNLKTQPGLRLPQGTYRFSNETLGEWEMFITQAADNATGSWFESVFS